MDVAIAVPASSSDEFNSIDQRQLAQILISLPFTVTTKEEEISKETILEQIQQLDNLAVKKIAQQEKEQDDEAAARCYYNNSFNIIINITGRTTCC